MNPAITLLSKDKPLLQYRHMTLIDIAKRIVFHCDHQALTEFHTNRTVFSYNNSKPMLFIDFLDKLKRASADAHWSTKNGLEISEMAYDHTVNKFTCLPCSESSSGTPLENGNNFVKRSGTDCRLYFRAFLKHTKKLQENHRIQCQIKQEYRVASAMRGMVRRHFYLSRLEAVRKNNVFWSRYYWDINGDKITVWMPKAIKGSQRRKWLEINIESPNPSAPDEQKRIQAIINQKLVKEKFVSISEADKKSDNERRWLWSDSDETLGISLAKAVSTEKVININKQRRSIKALGKENLERLILNIFDNIQNIGSNDLKLAETFGLSKATFSRFAGRRWFQSNSGIPDLWLNTAQVLSNHARFKRVVIKTGFLDKIKSTIKKGTNRN